MTKEFKKKIYLKKNIPYGLLKALKEDKLIEKNPNKYKRYKSCEEMTKELEKE